MAVITTEEPTPEQHKPEEAHKPGSFRDRVLQYVAEGPHLTHEEAEDIRKLLWEAREENFVQDLSARQ